MQRKWKSSIGQRWEIPTRDQRIDTFWPLPSSTALLIISMIHWVRTVIANASRGRITIGIAAFDSTVVRSETGSRFPEQNAAIAAFPVQGIDRVEHARR